MYIEAYCFWYLLWYDTDSLAIICYYQIFFPLQLAKKRIHFNLLQAKHQRRLDLAIEIEGRRGTRRIHVEGHGACTSSCPHASASASANTCTGAECWMVAGIWKFLFVEFCSFCPIEWDLTNGPLRRVLELLNTQV